MDSCCHLFPLFLPRSTYPVSGRTVKKSIVVPHQQPTGLPLIGRVIPLGYSPTVMPTTTGRRKAIEPTHRTIRTEAPTVLPLKKRGYPTRPHDAGESRITVIVLPVMPGITDCSWFLTVLPHQPGSSVDLG